MRATRLVSLGGLVAAVSVSVPLTTTSNRLTMAARPATTVAARYAVPAARLNRYTPPDPPTTTTSTTSTTRPAPPPRRTVSPPARTVPASPVVSGDVWGCIARLESGGNPAANTGNGFYGAWQFTLSSWQAAGGGPGLPSSYSYGAQLAVAQRLQQIQGWGAWPNTAPRCGV